jgi:hypothetical protein
MDMAVAMLAFQKMFLDDPSVVWTGRIEKDEVFAQRPKAGDARPGMRR